VIGEGNELRALAEVAVAAAIAVGRGDGRGAERAPVITALEGEHQTLAVRGIAHELERILDRLGAADIEMHPALAAEFPLDILADGGRQLDLLAVEVLRGDLREAVDLALQRIVEARIGIAEIDGRIPHLQVEERRIRPIIDERAFAALEDLGDFRVMDGIAIGAIPGFQFEEVFLVGNGGWYSQRLGDLIKH
jgi:hypothetical protein